MGGSVEVGEAGVNGYDDELYGVVFLPGDTADEKGVNGQSRHRIWSISLLGIMPIYGIWNMEYNYTND